MVESNKIDQGEVKITPSNGFPLRNALGGLRVRKIQQNLPLDRLLEQEKLTPD